MAIDEVRHNIFEHTGEICIMDDDVETGDRVTNSVLRLIFLEAIGGLHLVSSGLVHDLLFAMALLFFGCLGSTITSQVGMRVMVIRRVRRLCRRFLW
jgi:hypothetical protein